jgi:DNA-binding MarR family transcriptional regulator
MMASDPARCGAAGQDDLVDALVRAAFVTTALLSRVGAEYDLSLTQLRVLGILRDRRLRMTALADFLGLEKSTMSGLVDRAERRGLLQRAASAADGRAVEVFLSPAGLDLAERFHSGVEQALSPLTRTLAPAEQRRLQALLERMLGAHAAPERPPRW